MIIPCFTTVFPTDLFLFCLLILFYLVLAALGLALVYVVGFAFYEIGRMIWFALTGRGHIIKQEFREEFLHKK